MSYTQYCTIQCSLCWWTMLPILTTNDWLQTCREFVSFSAKFKLLVTWMQFQPGFIPSVCIRAGELPNKCRGGGAGYFRCYSTLFSLILHIATTTLHRRQHALTIQISTRSTPSPIRSSHDDIPICGMHSDMFATFWAKQQKTGLSLHLSERNK